MTTNFVPKGVAHVPVAGGHTPIRVTFVLLANFSLIAFSSAIEPLRIANQLSGKPLFEWQVLSEDGGKLCCSNGLEVTPEGPLSATLPRSMIFVCAGVQPELATTGPVTDWLRQQWRMRRVVGGLCSGAYALAQAGILEGCKFTLHWENLPPFVETFPHLNPVDQLYCIDDRIMTCAGGAAATDLFIEIISRNHGANMADAVLKMCLHGPQRPADLRQRMSISSTIGTRNPKVIAAIQAFERNVTVPLDLDTLTDYVGTSKRQIQRLFQQHLGMSPMQYLNGLRLERARMLLTQTEMSVSDIAHSCGYEITETFSRAFRSKYGNAPRRFSNIAQTQGPLINLVASA